MEFGHKWNKMYGCLSENKKFLEFAWKDQNEVLFMTTVSNGRKAVKKKSSSCNLNSHKRTCPPDCARKELSLPEFIDMYNHFMNGVDNADQLCCYYERERQTTVRCKTLGGGAKLAARPAILLPQPPPNTSRRYFTLHRCGITIK